MPCYPTPAPLFRGLLYINGPMGDLGLCICDSILCLFAMDSTTISAAAAAAAARLSSFNLYSTLSATILVLLFVIMIKKRSSSSRMPPGPPGWPIVGNLFQIGNKSHESFFHLAKKYGPLMTIRLGMTTVVVVSSPSMAKEVLKTHDQLFVGRALPHAVKSGPNSNFSLLWSQYGPRWRMLRKICATELFSVSRLNALQHLRRDQVFQAIRQISDEHHLNGKPVNIGLAAFLATANLLGNMIFSQNIFGWGSEAAEELKKRISKILQSGGASNLADFFPFLQFLDPQGISGHRNSNLKRVLDLWDKFVEDRLSSTAGNYEAPAKDLLDVLIEYYRRNEDDGEGAKFTRADIAPFIYDLFAAGADTTSTTIEWAMSELIRNPEVMKNTQAELDKVVGRDRRVEESDIQNLPYLQTVVKETFRLHSPGSFLLPHRAESRCEIAGYVIPKHTKVLVNIWAIGRDPSTWDKPWDFIPERFLEREIDFKGNDLELIPFGAGRRICAGLPLATRMVHFLIASLVHSFDWSLPNGQNPQEMDMTKKSGIVLEKAVPLMAISTPRLPTSLYQTVTLN